MMASEKHLFSPAILNAETMHLLDEGACGMAINTALDQAIRDVENRGSDGAKRKVVITLTFAKDLDQKSQPVEIDCDVKMTMPALKTARTTAKVSLARGKAELKFSPESASNPEQTSFVDGDGEVRE